MTTEQAASAASFTASIGVNAGTDMDTSAADQNVTAEENALAFLDVKLVRAHAASFAVPAYAQWNQDLGIKYDFTVNGLSTSGFNGSLQMIKANSGIIAYVEGPNESDEPSAVANYNGLTGLSATAAEMQALYSAVHSNPQLAGVGVIQASFAFSSTFATYGNHAGSADYANTHVYYFNSNPLGTEPTLDSGRWLQSYLTNAQLATPGAPNIVTETGYETLAGTTQAVSLIDQAKYLLEAVFDLWNAGVVKSFIYNLVDGGPNAANPSRISNNYGLYNADWTPKPAAIALHNLMTLLADPGTGGVAPGSLSYSLSGEPSTVQTTLLEKSDGRFVLAIWNEVRLQNASGADANIAAVPVTLTLGGVYDSITIYDPLTGTSAVQTFSNAQTVTIMVPDYPVLIDISKTAGAPAVAPVNQPVINAPTQVLGAADSIIQVGGLSIGNVQIGNITVQVTDSLGTLSMRDANNQALTGSGTDSITLSGSAAIVNAELATLAYAAPTAGGNDTISLQVTGTTGTVASDFISVNQISRPAFTASIGPLLSVPSTMTVATGSDSAVADAVLTNDYDAVNTGTMSMTVAAENGKIDMDSNGVALAAASSLTVTGSYAQLAADLQTLTYLAGSKTGQDILSFQVADLNQGTGASGDATTASISINVAPALAINDPSAMQLVEGTSGAVGVQIDDAQAVGNADQVTVTVSDRTGTLTMVARDGHLRRPSDGGHKIIVSGTPDQVNEELATLVENAPSSVSDDTVTFIVMDSQGATASDSFGVTVVSAVAITAPANLPLGFNAIAPISGVSITDSDAAASGLRETVIVSDSYGKLAMTDGAGNNVAGSGGHSITLTGSEDVVNAELATLTYSAPGSAITDNISITASDTAGGSSSQSIAVPITASGVLPTYFQLSDTADDPTNRQPFLSSGGMVLTPAATGLNGAVSEQVAGGVTTLTAEQWNTVYGVTMVDASGNSYALDNFRFVNATLEAGPTAAGQAQTLTVNTAQNGTVTLGSGNQNVVINAGLGGAAVGTGKTFDIAEGSGTDMLTVNGYAGYLPTTNVANMTTAIVTAGSGTENMTFVNAHAAITAGAGALTIHGSNYGTHVIAEAGSVDVWGGSGSNLFNYATGDGLMTIEDFSNQDTLSLKSSLKAGMTQKTVSGGVELLFAASPHGGIMLKGQTSDVLSHITWS